MNKRFIFIKGNLENEVGVLYDDSEDVYVFRENGKFLDELYADRAIEYEHVFLDEEELAVILANYFKEKRDDDLKDETNGQKPYIIFIQNAVDDIQETYDSSVRIYRDETYATIWKHYQPVLQTTRWIAIFVFVIGFLIGHFLFR